MELEHLIKRRSDAQAAERVARDVFNELSLTEAEALQQIAERPQNFYFWIGAGCSVSSGIPLSSEIIDYISVRVYEKTHPADRGKKTAADIFDWLKREKWFNTNFPYISALEKEFPSVTLRTEYFSKLIKDKDPSPSHFHLAMQMKHHKLANTLVTTNFDNLLEKAFAILKGVSIITIRAFDQLSEIKDDDRRYLIKIHGDYNHYEVKYLRQGMGRLFDDMEARVTQMATSDYLLVFLGYSGTEVGVLNLFHKLLDKEPNAFNGGVLFAVKDSVRKVDPKIAEFIQRADLMGKKARLFEIEDSDKFLEKLSGLWALPTVQDELSQSFRYFNIYDFRGQRSREKMIRPTLKDISDKELLDEGFLINDFREILDGLKKTFLQNWLQKKEEKEREAIEVRRKALINIFVDLKREQYQVANEKLQELMKLYPDSEGVHYGRGYALWHLGQYQSCYEAFDKAIKLNEEEAKTIQIKQDLARIVEKRANYIYCKALAAYDSKDYNLAINFFKLATELNPKRDVFWYNKGLCHCETRDLDNELKSYEKAVEVNQANAMAWYNFGCVYHDQHKELLAMKCFERSAELNRNLVGAYFNTGTILGQMGQNYRALEYFRRVLELDNTDKEAIFNFATGLMKTKQYTNACEAFDAYLTYEPNDMQALHNLGLCYYEDENMDKAADCFEKYKNLRQDDPIHWYNHGRVLVHIKEYEKALQYFDKSLSLESSNELVWYKKGRLLGKMGRFNEQIEWLEKYLAVNPEDDQAWYELGNAYGEVDNWEKEVEAYDRSLDLRPINTKARLERSIACNQIGLKAIHSKDNLAARKAFLDALHEMDGLLRYRSDDPELWFHRGISLDHLAEIDLPEDKEENFALKAVESYDQCVKRNNNHYKAWCNKGVLLANLEQYAKAIECFDECLKIIPDYHSALMNKTISFYSLKEYQRAMDSAEAAVAKIPGDAELWITYAHVAKGIHSLDRIAKGLEEAFKLKSGIKLTVIEEGAFDDFKNDPRILKLLS